MQELEFCSLMGTTLAMAHSGQPILCNGANLAFEKKAFEELGGFKIGRELASGDDLFLLFAVKRSTSLQVHYGAHPDVVAYTPATHSLGAFLAQRIRWGGKSRHYNDLPALRTAILVLMVNGVLLLSLTLGALSVWPWYLVACLWALKFLPDLIFLSAVTGWFDRRSILWVSPLVLIIYPFYIVFTGLIGLVWKPKWKGRRI
jgi:cellulose synthase/poly-beta-1,6-N-acetylglucosamine synthase-like glycosyltransferase